MAVLTNKDQETIEKYPLKDSRSYLQELSEQLCDLKDVDNDNSELLETASRLISTLHGHPAAFKLGSRTSGLLTILRVISDGDFQYDYYRALLQLVINKASDVEIWAAVFDLIAKYTSPLSSPNDPPVYPDTPISSTSSSLRGSEQTLNLVKKRIFEEIRSCTYDDVEGFFEKYLEETSWVEQADRISQTCSTRHINGRWVDFPDPPTQNSVLKWWFDFQDEFLPDGHSLYCSSRDIPVSGSRAIRKLDLFIRRADLRDKPHDWKDVRVVGELKQGEEDYKNILLQLGAYAREVFASQPTRLFLHAFTLCGTVMRLWVFDRSGPYCSTTFDIHEKWERFVYTIVGYTMMSDRELGLSEFVEVINGVPYITADIDNGPGMRLELDNNPIALQRAIVCRGTTCYRARMVGTEQWQYVVKFSWRSDKRQSEAKLLRRAQERGVEGVAKLVTHQKIVSIGELRDGLRFKEPHRFLLPADTSGSFTPQSLAKLAVKRSASQKQGLGTVNNSSSRKRKAESKLIRNSKRSRANSLLSQSVHSTTNQSFSEYDDSQFFEVEKGKKTSLFGKNTVLFDNREFSCLIISPHGQPLRKFKNIKQLLEAFRDAIKGHLSLYEKGEILHRDISENNIIMTTGDHKGMLIDLDLAKKLGATNSGARYRTGTMEFMAIEVLDGVSHTYRHDLESFFYVFIWVCISYGWELQGGAKERPMPRVLRKWYTGDYDDIAASKRGTMGKQSFEKVLCEFPPACEQGKDMARTVRRTLFPIRDGDLFTGTFTNHRRVYDPIIQAFDEAAQECEE